MKIQIFLAIAMLAITACKKPLTITKDPFNNSTIYNCEINNNNDMMPKSNSHELKINSVNLYAVKLHNKIITNKLIFQFESDYNFLLTGNHIEMMYKGKSYKIYTERISESKSTEVRAEGTSYGVMTGSGNVNKTGSLKFSNSNASSINISDMTTIINDKYVANYAVVMNDELFSLLKSFDLSKSNNPNIDADNLDQLLLFRVEASTRNGEKTIIFTNSDGNGRFGIIHNLLEFYQSLSRAPEEPNLPSPTQEAQ